MPDHQIELNDPAYYLSEPKRQIGCSLATAGDFDGAVADLIAHGISQSDLRALHGQPGADIIDILGEHHGLIANIRRIFPTINNHVMENMGNVDQVLKAGGYALLAPAAEYEDAKAIADLLRGHNAANIFYFGKRRMWRFN